jgi:hypothetical protein
MRALDPVTPSAARHAVIPGVTSAIVLAVDPIEKVSIRHFGRLVERLLEWGLLAVDAVPAGDEKELILREVKEYPPPPAIVAVLGVEAVE